VTEEASAAARRPRRLRRLLAIAVLLLALDWLQPAGRQLSARAALAAIAVYQQVLSPRMPGFGVRCRFADPTCSHYGAAVLRCYGFPRGAGLAAWRILRCGPWTKLGTSDPPPCSDPEPGGARQPGGGPAPSAPPSPRGEE